MIRKTVFRLGLFAAVMAVLPLMASAGVQDGDVNGDGEVNLEDINFIARMTIGKELTDLEADFNGNGKIDAGDVIELIEFVRSLTPTPTQTPEPTPTPTPAPSPTPDGNTFDIEDYFPTVGGSMYDFDNSPGASPDDNYVWEVLGDTFDVGDGSGPLASQFQYNTDEPDDDRSGDRDFFFIDGDGNLFFYGFHKGIDTLDPLPEGDGAGLQGNKDNILSDPVLVGTRDMTVGQTIMDGGSGIIHFYLFNNPMSQSVNVTGTATYTGFEDVTTPLGTFTDCLRVEVDVSVAGETFRGSTFWLKEGVGLVQQDQEPDANDAEAHWLVSGTVGGTPIVANGLGPAPKPAAAE